MKTPCITVGALHPRPQTREWLQWHDVQAVDVVWGACNLRLPVHFAILRRLLVLVELSVPVSLCSTPDVELAMLSALDRQNTETRNIVTRPVQL